MTHKIHINAPIWHKRSVGINLMNISPGDMVEIEILYVRKKDGVRIYPHTFEMLASEIHKYPIQKIKGVVLHIVPLDSLRTKEEEVAISPI